MHHEWKFAALGNRVTVSVRYGDCKLYLNGELRDRAGMAYKGPVAWLTVLRAPVHGPDGQAGELEVQARQSWWWFFCLQGGSEVRVRVRVNGQPVSEAA